MTVVAVIPAKSDSRRVPDKNFAPFFRGLCLVELKILNLQHAGITEIVLSSNDFRARGIADKFGIEFQRRPDELCGDVVVLADLFRFCLRDLQDRLVYWAHPTSPFVTPSTMSSAVQIAEQNPESCTLGVQETREFFWSKDRPINYDPCHQPRSQDLEPIYRVTGGIHIGQGRQFCIHGAVSFCPAYFVRISTIESIDINTPEDWGIASLLSEQSLQHLAETT